MCKKKTALTNAENARDLWVLEECADEHRKRPEGFQTVARLRFRFCLQGPRSELLPSTCEAKYILSMPMFVSMILIVSVPRCEFRPLQVRELRKQTRALGQEL